MATYKVIQDIEAEDKLIGWMSPRQTIYAAIVVISIAIGFFFATKIAWWMVIPLVPHTILFSVLAGPFGGDQPTELWLLAKIQFALKPRKRIWNQSGISEMVTITVPKKIEKHLTDGLSQTEVKSRLKALATTIDSRGWAVKNVNVNLYAQPAYATGVSDRLISSGAFPQEVANYDIAANDDILDAQNNSTAQNLDRMITASTAAHRQQIMTTMREHSSAPPQPAQQEQQWYTQPATESDQQILSKIRESKQASSLGNSRMRTIQPGGTTPTPALTSKQAEKAAPVKTEEPVAKKEVDPRIQQLANNDNFMVDTIARQAKKDFGNDEVVISLH